MERNYPKIAHFQQSGEGFMCEDNCCWYVQEKVDGSQLSFRRDAKDDDVLFFNKGKLLTPQNAKFFSKSVQAILALKSNLNPDFIYHGEAVTRPKHNVLAYQKAPKHFWICFDIYDTQKERWLHPDEGLTEECERIGVECVPVVYRNQDSAVNPKTKCKELLQLIEKGELTSCLGNKMEGLVLKHPRFINVHKGGKITASKFKFVTEEFQESHKPNPGKSAQNAEEIGQMYNTGPRFAKAVQHLKETGMWKENLPGARPGSEPIMANYPLLLKELDSDLEQECREEILKVLEKLFMPRIKEAARRDLKEWMLSLSNQ
jgi:hypothetical protein